MKIKYSTINAFIFIIAMTVQIFTATIEQSGLISMAKYLICCVGIFYTFVFLHPKTKVFYYETKNIVTVVIVFLLITAFKVLAYGHFTSRTFYEAFFMLLPAIYAYCLLNTLSFKTIEKCMFIMLIISLSGYLISLNLGVSAIINGFRSMSFSNSYSALESHSYAGISLAFALYYLFFRKNKIGMVLSVLFVIMTFKRLAILTVIVLIFLPKIIDSDREVNKIWLTITKVGVFLVGILYFAAMIPSNIAFVESLFNVDLQAFTMGRTYRFLYAYSGLGFRNGGLGSIYTYLLKNYHISIEMDFCKLLFEVTPIGVILFVNNFYNVCKKSVYCYLIMSYLFLNMITSHCLASVFTWLIIYVTFGMIEYKQYEHTVSEKQRRGNIE